MLHSFHRSEFDANAFPAGLRVVSLALSTFVIGAILLEAASAAAVTLA